MSKSSAEEAALAAVMDQDYGEARRIVEDFFPTELDVFADQLETLRDMVRTALREKSAR